MKQVKVRGLSSKMSKNEWLVCLIGYTLNAVGSGE